MKNEDNIPQKKNYQINYWKPSAQPTDNSDNAETIDPPIITARKANSQRKAQEKREVRRLRLKNEQERLQKQSRKSSQRAALKRLSTAEQRSAFIAARGTEKKAAAASAKAETTARKREIAQMRPEERKAFHKEEQYQRRIKRKASRAYMPLLVLKFAALAAAAAGVVYLGIVAYGVFVDNSYVFHNTGQPIARPSNHQNADASDTVDPYSLLLSGADLDFMKHRVNILVVGIDNNAERDDPGSYDRTDTMLLMSVDFETNNVYIISLPRDSYVWIYNKNYRSRLNTAFGTGGGLNGDGFEYAMNTVSMLLGGIPVNNYVCFDMDVVMDVVNAMDGIDYDVDVAFTLDGRSLKTGPQHLDGQCVLDYCRVRENITGGTDIARTARQRKMIMAIFQSMKENGQIQDIPAIYSAIASNIYTDLTFEQITSLAAFGLKLNSDSLHDYLLPGKYLNKFDGPSFWGIDQSRVKDMVYEIFGQTIKTDPSNDVDTLLGLLDQKNQAISDGNAAISDAQSYINANSALIPADLLSHFNALKKTLKDAMAVKNPYDISSTIEPITEATKALDKWLKNTLKPAVEAAMAAATPTPEPSDTPAPSESTAPSDSVAPSDAATTTPAPTQTATP